MFSGISSLVRQRDEMRHHACLALESLPAQLLQRETARCHQEIDFAQAAVDQPGVAPELRRASRMQGAANAIALGASLPAEGEEHVSWADQPVFVRGIEL